MLLGHITQLKSHAPFLNPPAWSQAFDWIKSSTNQSDGDYKIDSRNIYASIQTVSTIPHAEGKIERHFEYIDIHYCISGREIIEWIPVDQLTQPIETNRDKDYALYNPVEGLTTLRMTPGTFAIFLPEDAHMPKITTSTQTTTTKIVVKIKYDLLKA